MFDFVNFVDVCKDLMPILKFVKAVIDLIRIGIPILLIVFGMLDLGKAVMAGKEDDMKKAQGSLIKRCIYAVAVFFVVTIVILLFNLFAGTGVEGEETTDDWYSCWKKV